jgi:hypothetical protein
MRRLPAGQQWPRLFLKCHSDGAVRPARAAGRPAPRRRLRHRGCLRSPPRRCAALRPPSRRATASRLNCSSYECRVVGSVFMIRLGCLPYFCCPHTRRRLTSKLRPNGRAAHCADDLIPKAAAMDGGTTLPPGGRRKTGAGGRGCVTRGKNPAEETLHGAAGLGKTNEIFIFHTKIQPPITHCSYEKTRTLLALPGL